jgi:hypothetical protein
MLVETAINDGAPVKTALGISLLASLLVVSITLGSSHYTKAHLDALASRVGMVYWIASADSRTPIFLSAPTKSAASFRARENESFEITELVGQKEINTYYKVKFDSGKVGYISPEAFLDELNLTILSVDPRASDKKKATEAAEVEKKRGQIFILDIRPSISIKAPYGPSAADPDCRRFLSRRLPRQRTQSDLP